MSDQPIGSVWKLASNRGWEALQCTVLGHQAVDPASGVLLDIALTGEFWDRSVPLTDAALTEDFHIRFPQVLVSLARLRELEAGLREYVALPLDELRAEPLGLQSRLGLAGHQFDLHFGADAELVTSSDKPVVSITLARGSTLRCEKAFVTDQSCIRDFTDALGSYLRVVRANPG